LKKLRLIGNFPIKRFGATEVFELRRAKKQQAEQDRERMQATGTAPPVYRIAVGGLLGEDEFFSPPTTPWIKIKIQSIEAMDR